MSKIRLVGIPFLVLALSLVATVLMVKFRRTAAPIEQVNEVPTVEVLPLEAVDFPIQIESQGTVEAATAIRLISEVDGRVTFISPALKPGGFFQEGELLVAIDDRDFELAVTRQSAQVASARLRVATVEAEADVAVRDWEELGEQGEPSALLLRQPQLIEARSTLAAAEADLKKAELDLERTTIKAPFTGRVRTASADVGQFVRRGEELSTLFGIERVEVSLPLPLSDLKELNLPKEKTRAGFEASPTRVTLHGNYGGVPQEWTGNLVRVEGEIDVRSRMATVVAEIQDPYGLEASDEVVPLRVGMFVEAVVEGKTAKRVYEVPRVFVMENKRILLVDQDGALRIRDVAIRRADRERALIAGGVQPGDRLCVSIVDTPVEGMRVNPVEAKKEAE